jgi:hypothetical protein
MMFKPALAVMVGLVCAAAAAAELSVLGSAGNGGDDAAHAVSARTDAGPAAATDRQQFAQIPASNDAYGWRYPYAFPTQAPVMAGQAATPPAAVVRGRR